MSKIDHKYTHDRACKFINRLYDSDIKVDEGLTEDLHQMCQDIAFHHATKTRTDILVSLTKKIEDMRL